MIYEPYHFQDKALEHVLTHKESCLFMKMGLGKTVVSLTAIDKLLNEEFAVSKVLVIGPKKVIQSTWPDEQRKWDHLKNLKLIVIEGSATERVRRLNLKYDIYCINRENVKWLVDHYKEKFPFDMVVIDELSSFKDARTNRFKSLRMVRPRVKWIIGLTGTPTGNSMLDLWPEIYLIDRGRRLGPTLGEFRRQYFRPDKQVGNIIYSYKVLPGADQLIMNRIRDICISMDDKDYLDLPEMIERDETIEFGKDLQEKYQALERDRILDLEEEEEEVVATSAVVVVGKLVQFTSGFLYTDSVNWKKVHELKFEKLDEILEAALDEPVVVFYWFRAELEQLQKKYPGARELKKPQDIDDWNQGKIKILLAHPQSAGHGLNLQFGGSIIVWFTIPWSIELYLQGNKRLHRPGQKQPVRIFRIIAQDTIDEDIVRALDRKELTLERLMEEVKYRVDGIIQTYRS